MTATRRLAAIFAADVVGYSRLMGEDEEGTLSRLNAHRRDLVDRKIGDHHGRIVKTTGDGLLAEFASVVDAVRCAAEVQRVMIERNSQIDQARRIVFRIGINLGDIIIEHGDIFGDGVNVAARLEALAEPGGICISGTVRDHIGDRLPYPFIDMGPQSVKNIARPVSAFSLGPAAVAEIPVVPLKPRPRFSRARIFAAATVVLLFSAGVTGWRLWPTPTSDTIHIKSASRLSVVVLPFANLSNGAEQEHFAEAVTDNLTTDLSRVVGSFVLAHETASTLKGKAIDARRIGTEFGVRYIVEGSTHRLGDDIEVNVQLIDAETGAHIWASRFDTNAGDPGKAQSEIAGRLARSLQLELMETVGRRIEQEDRAQLSAPDFVLLGWAWFYRGISTDHLLEARRAFEQALQLAPVSDDARVGLGRILIETVIGGWSQSPEQDVARAEELLLSALERDRADPMLHISLGIVRRIQRRYPDSKIEFETALTLDQINPVAMLQLGYTLETLGQSEAAIPLFETALRLVPVDNNAYYYYFGLGQAHLYLGHTDEAIGFFRRARAANSQHYQIPLFLAAALGLRGDIEEAKTELENAIKLRPGVRSLADWHRTLPAYSVPQFVAIADRTLDLGLRRAGMPDE